MSPEKFGDLFNTQRVDIAAPYGYNIDIHNHNIGGEQSGARFS